MAHNGPKPLPHHCQIHNKDIEGLNLQQVLISDLPEPHEIRLQAVNFLVDLHVSQSLPPQLLLQLLLAAVDLLHP